MTTQADEAQKKDVVGEFIKRRNKEREAEKAPVYRDYGIRKEQTPGGSPR